MVHEAAFDEDGRRFGFFEDIKIFFFVTVAIGAVIPFDDVGQVGLKVAQDDIADRVRSGLTDGGKTFDAGTASGIGMDGQEPYIAVRFIDLVGPIGAGFEGGVGIFRRDVVVRDVFAVELFDDAVDYPSVEHAFIEDAFVPVRTTFSGCLIDSVDQASVAVVENDGFAHGI